MYPCSTTGFHLIVGKGVVRLSQHLKEHHTRPAIYALSCSAAEVYGQRVIGVLLSGMLEDRVEGAKEIKDTAGWQLCKTLLKPGSRRCR